MFYSGEVHPWRIPSPGLWLDIFQKIRALGYTGVSFYVDWALLEGNPGHFTAEGVFGYEQFFAAAAEAGIYLLARPGGYVNAEISGGGFPGWLGREPANLRTNMTGFIEAQSNYIANIGKVIAEAQITNGGPVVLLQADNEYTYGVDWVYTALSQATLGSGLIQHPRSSSRTFHTGRRSTSSSAMRASSCHLSITRHNPSAFSLLETQVDQTFTVGIHNQRVLAKTDSNV